MVRLFPLIHGEEIFYIDIILNTKNSTLQQFENWLHTKVAIFYRFVNVRPAEKLYLMQSESQILSLDLFR